MHHDQYQVHRIEAATLLQSKRKTFNFGKILAAELDTHICVTAHHAKFLRIESEEGPLSSHSCDCTLDATASKVHTHPSLALFTVFFPCSTKFAYCKWRLDAAETWQQGYESVSFVARYSFLHCRAGLDEARSDDAVHSGSLLRIRSGPLHGDSWTIQVHFLCNHPPSICGTWAMSAHGCLLRTIQYIHITEVWNSRAPLYFRESS